MPYEATNSDLHHWVDRWEHVNFNCVDHEHPQTYVTALHVGWHGCHRSFNRWGRPYKILYEETWVKRL